MTVEPPAQPKRRRWLPRIRYSLRTLLIFTLLAGSGMGLWFRWEPWAFSEIYEKSPFELKRSKDGRFILFLKGKELWLSDSQTSCSNPLNEICPEVIAEFSPDGKMLAFTSPIKDGGGACEVVVLETATLRRLCTLPHPQQVQALAFSPAARELATAYYSQPGQSMQATLWGLSQNQPRLSFAADYPGRLPPGNHMLMQDGTKLSYSPDGRRLAAGNRGDAAVFDTATGAAVYGIEGQGLGIQDFFYLPGSSSLVTLSNGRVSVWDEQTKAELFEIEREYAALRVTCSPDGKKLLVLVGKGVSLLSATDGTEFYTFKGLAFPIGSFGFQANGRYIEFERDDLTTPSARKVEVWRRNRPEYRWGIIWLPEFWLSLVFGCAFVLSVRRDWLELRRPKGEVPA